MPLSCLDERNWKIQAFDLNDEEWLQLKTRNRKFGGLRMPCCDAEVVLKQSKLGTRFFAHRRGACLTSKEGEEHRQLKLIAVDVARGCGWEAHTEVPGIAPSGEKWIADVLATKGSTRIAIEVQWSAQTSAETLRRQKLYMESGVRGLWLLRQPGFPIMRELPAVCVGGDLNEGFYALLPYRGAKVTRNDRIKRSGWKSVIPMRDLLHAAFTQRLKWGLVTEIGAGAEAEVFVAESDCDQCGVITDIVAGVDLIIAGSRFDFSLRDFTGCKGLVSQFFRELSAEYELRHIKVRYSRAMGERYLSNGCSGCDRLIGDFYLGNYREQAKVVYRFPVELTDQWLDLIKSSDSFDEDAPEWWVLDAASVVPKV